MSPLLIVERSYPMLRHEAYVIAHAKIARLFKDKEQAANSNVEAAKAYLQLEVEFRKEFSKLFEAATKGQMTGQAMAWQLENCLIRARVNLEANLNHEDLEETIEVFAFGFTGKIRKFK